MKNFTIVLSFLLIASAGLLNAQDNLKKFSGPHDFFPENSRTKILQGNIPDGEFLYAPLPVPYNNVNLSNDPFPQNEPSVKFNYKYPNRVVAAWRDFRTGVNPAIRRIGYCYSTDGGTTWSQSELIPIVDPNHPKSSDPVVCSDTAGNFYIATVSITDAGALDLLVFKSTDGGVTFPSVYFAQGGGANSEDKEWLVCDLSAGSPYRNTLYMTWTRFGNPAGILLTKSTNGGVNWSSHVQVSSGGGVQGSCPAIGPNGEVYVVWVGGTFTTDIIYFDKSTNGGVSFGTDRNIAQGPSPQIPITSSSVTFPSIAVDVSGGPLNGHVYVTWCDARNGDPDIFLIKSTNGGINWSSPLRINDDTLGNGKLQCWPWIAVNEDGKIAILYYDSRNGTGNTNIEAWIARSTDGGQTFINEKLSSEIFTASWPNTDVRFGDYINVDYYGTRISAVWTDLRAGGSNQEIYTAVVDLSTGLKNISGTIPENYILGQNYPNPFNPVTKIKYSIKESGLVTLKVYDMLGREKAVLVSERQKAGTYETDFDAGKLASGVYFYRLTTDNFTDTKKMMLVK